MQFNLVKVNLLGIKIRTSRLGLRIFFLDKAVHRYCVNQDSSVERTLPETSFPETLWLCKPTVASAVQVKKQHVEVLYFYQSGISKQNQLLFDSWILSKTLAAELISHTCRPVAMNDLERGKCGSNAFLGSSAALWSW